MMVPPLATKFSPVSGVAGGIVLNSYGVRLLLIVQDGVFILRLHVAGWSFPPVTPQDGNVSLLLQDAGGVSFFLW